MFSTKWLVAQSVKNLPAVQETQVRSLDGEDPLEKERATHSSILAWKTPWTEEPGGLQSVGSQRVRHDWATNPYLPLTLQCPAVWYKCWPWAKLEFPRPNFGNNCCFLVPPNSTYLKNALFLGISHAFKGNFTITQMRVKFLVTAWMSFCYSSRNKCSPVILGLVLPPDQEFHNFWNFPACQ